MKQIDSQKMIQFPTHPGDTAIHLPHLPDEASARFGQGYVSDVALSPDGTSLAVASDIGLWWYDLSTQALSTLWDDGQSPYTAVTFSSNGRWIALSDRHRVVTVWDVANGTCISTFATGSKRNISELAFSSDNKHLAAGGGEDADENFVVNVWPMPQDDTGGAEPADVRAYQGTYPLAFSPDNRLLACAKRRPTRCITPREEGIISVWDMETQECIASLTGLPVWIGSLSFSPCGSYLAAGDWEGAVNVWELPSGHLHKTYPSRGESYMLVSYSPEGVLRATAISREGSAVVWDVESAERRYESESNIRYFPAQFSSGAHLTFGSLLHFHLWTVDMPCLQTVRHRHVGYSASLHFSPDGKTLLARDRESGIFSLDVANPDQPPAVFNMRAATGLIPASQGALFSTDSNSREVYLAVEVAPEGKRFAISADENSVRLWEVGNTTPLAEFTTQAEPCCAAFSPPANRLACTDEAGQIYLWNVQTAALCYTERSEYPPVSVFDARPLELSATGEYLLSSPDGLYDVNRNEKVRAFPIAEMIQYLAFSPDGTRLAGETRDTLLLWDIPQGEMVLSLEKPGNWGANVEAVAFSPCGGYLAACATDIGHLQLWSLHSGERLAAFDLPRVAACLAFSPDGTLLASGISDGTILLWDMRPYLHENSD